MISAHANIVWFVLGFIFIFIELAGVSGLGFLFAGLGAITMCGVITFKFISADNLLQHIAYFLFFTLLWWGTFWRPLRKSKSKDEYKNLIGTEAVISDEAGLEAGKVGNIKWSGTIVRARITPDSETPRINFGENVFVHGQKDGVFLVDVTKL